MNLIFGIDKWDPLFYFKIWRTYKCACGSQDVRVADCSKVVQCSDCNKEMEPQIFVTACNDGVILSFHRPLERLPKKIEKKVYDVQW